MRAALDIRRPFRYVRGRAYLYAVWIHYHLHFARHVEPDPTGSGRVSAMLTMHLERAKRDKHLSLPDPLCAIDCETVGGADDCTCLSAEEFRARLETRMVGTPMVPAPFTGTPYRPDPEE